MIDHEKLGLFYLGRLIPEGAADPDRQAPLLLDARDLTTHAVCVGMTGSGKTGLCLALLEEAAIDGIPAIAVDPKGDLGNLLLAFPELRPEDFRPWIDEDEARRQGLAPETLAARTADRWREGLARWDQDGARIARMRAACDFALYTPGGSFGRPLSVRRTFAPPAGSTPIDELRERVGGAVSGLLALLGIEADPLRSREHAFLSTVLTAAWAEGRSLDLADLVRAVADPPFTRVGVLDLETFYPARERSELSLRLNNLLASPGFAAWLEGEPLDVQRLLYDPSGRPRLSVLTMAHLGDAERMFFVSLLLNEIVAWMRRQAGTSSLRALFYMDEVFGYFPPTAVPPCKPLLLTLLKQARAFGLGVVLSTQNPVDLDYKGLANAGTWFLGRLQTERDRDRLVDGLLGAAGGGLDRSALATRISSLPSRRFLWHSVHQRGPALFESRWALSYLRGPLSRPQIQALAASGPSLREREPGAGPGSASGVGDIARALAGIPAAPGPETPAAGGSATAPADTGLGPVPADTRPVLPPGLPELFVHPGIPAGPVVYRPHLFGQANLHYSGARQGVDLWRPAAVQVPLREPLPPNPWESAERVLWDEPPELSAEPPKSGSFAALPAPAAKVRSYAAWGRALAAWLYRSHPLRLWSCPERGEISRPGESEAEFRLRMTQSSREARDAEVDRIRAKYAGRRRSLLDRLRRAEERVGREQAQLDELKRASTIQIGATIVGALLGGRPRGVGGLSTAARRVSRARREEGDVARAAQEAEALRAQLTALDAEIERAALAAQQSVPPGGPAIEPLALAPRKADIVVERVALVWVGAAGS